MGPPPPHDNDQDSAHRRHDAHRRQRQADAAKLILSVVLMLAGVAITTYLSTQAAIANLRVDVARIGTDLANHKGLSPVHETPTDKEARVRTIVQDKMGVVSQQLSAMQRDMDALRSEVRQLRQEVAKTRAGPVGPYP